MLQKWKNVFKTYNRKSTVDYKTLNDAVTDQLFISNDEKKKKKKKNNKDWNLNLITDEIDDHHNVNNNFNVNDDNLYLSD